MVGMDRPIAEWNGKHGQSLHVLSLAHDNSQGQAVLQKLCETINHHTFELHPCDSANQALDILTQQSIDLVIVDETSAEEESQALLVHYLGSKTRAFFVVITEVYNHQKSQHWLEQGADDYLSWRQLTAPLLQRLGMFGKHFRKQDNHLERFEQIQSLITDTARDGFWCWNSSTKKMYVSQRWQEMRGARDKPSEYLSIDEWLASIYVEDQTQVRQTIRNMLQSKSKPTTIEYRIAAQAPPYSWMTSSITGVYNKLDACAMVIGWQQLREEKVMTHDPLTRLPNRKLFLERLNEAIIRAQRVQTYSFAVIYIDLDQFKKVNDSMGHEAGDQLLTQVSERLRTSLRMLDTVSRLDSPESPGSQTDIPTQLNIYEGIREPSQGTPLSSSILPDMQMHKLHSTITAITPLPQSNDPGTTESILTPKPAQTGPATCMSPVFSAEHLERQNLVSRFGGDEFAVLLEDVKNSKDAAVIAQRIQNLLQKPFMIKGQQIYTSASIGVAHSSNGAQSAQDLLRDADIAMYKAKDRGKAGYALFDTQMHQEIVAKLELETALRQALEQEMVQLFYQPIVSIAQGTIVGFEALLRWEHPQLGWVSPAEFVPIAEESGLIVQLGSWVLERACQQLYEWHQSLSPDLNININVSGKQLIQPHWVQNVQAQLLLTGVNPHRIRLEVTESSIIDKNQIQQDLQSIRDMGIKVQIDDFGTGYSSLSRLHELPVDALKIDKSFIRDMNVDPSRENIVTAIVKLGKSLHLDLVAEGIETEQQWRDLHGMGVHMGQGYYFGRPIPANQVPALFSQDEHQAPVHGTPQAKEEEAPSTHETPPPPSKLFTTASWY